MQTTGPTPPDRMVLCALNAQSLALMVGAAIADPQAAVAVSPLLIIPMLLYTGYLKSLDTLPSWLAWLQYLSPFKFGFEILMVNEFTGLPISCDPDRQLPCPVESGDQLLEYMGLTEQDMWIGFGALAALTVGFHLIALIALHLWYVIAR